MIINKIERKEKHLKELRRLREKREPEWFYNEQRAKRILKQIKEDFHET